MKKLLFLFAITWNCLLGQNSVTFTSQSFEDQQLTNTAYRGVGDSIQRFVQVRISSGSVDTLVITANAIEPELMFRGLFTPDTTNPYPTSFLSQGTGYIVQIFGNQLDSLIDLSLSTNNYNQRLDSNEVLTIRELSYVISCSGGDINNATNQSLYTLTIPNQTAHAQANAVVYGGGQMNSNIITNTFPGFCQDSVMRWDGYFCNNATNNTNAQPNAYSTSHFGFYFRLQGHRLDSFLLGNVMIKNQNGPAAHNHLPTATNPIPAPTSVGDYRFITRLNNPPNYQKSNTLDSLAQWYNTDFGLPDNDNDGFPDFNPFDTLRFSLFTSIPSCVDTTPNNTDFGLTTLSCAFAYTNGCGVPVVSHTTVGGNFSYGTGNTIQSGDVSDLETNQTAWYTWSWTNRNLNYTLTPQCDKNIWQFEFMRHAGLSIDSAVVSIGNLVYPLCLQSAYCDTSRGRRSANLVTLFRHHSLDRKPVNGKF